MLVYGRNVALEYLKKSEKVKKIYLQEGFHDEKINLLIEKGNIQPKYLPKFELDRLANGVHQGIILDVVDFSYTDYHKFIQDSESFVVILDHLEDPHNLGAIIRTSEAAGVNGIIIPKDRGVTVNSTVIKTSTGAIDNIPISLVTNLNQTISDLKKEGFWIVGTDMTNSTDYRKLDYSGKIALIIGNEGTGISRMVRESCDFMAEIPMYGKVNSLNASVAAGILIYEVVRQKR
ncbi:MAG: 23S rRNA (guanosine(2251)-2'-O)-methyltransferase RlmB [Tenericutes bacterium]|nr:23S rRNA (guanosine(2251)-2'-O)-methyltransferase RlmB [Mycoplasmatota bacterium]